MSNYSEDVLKSTGKKKGIYQFAQRCKLLVLKYNNINLMKSVFRPTISLLMCDSCTLRLARSKAALLFKRRDYNMLQHWKQRNTTLVHPNSFPERWKWNRIENCLCLFLLRKSMSIHNKKLSKLSSLRKTFLKKLLWVSIYTSVLFLMWLIPHFNWSICLSTLCQHRWT